MKSRMCLVAITAGLAFAAPNVFAATVHATLLDDAIQLDSSAAAAGKVTFVVTNASKTLPHEFVVLKTDTAQDQLPLMANGKVDERKASNKGEAENIAPGKTKKLTLKLPAGNYALVCNVAGHYKMGMHAAFTVNN